MPGEVTAVVQPAGDVPEQVDSEVTPNRALQGQDPELDTSQSHSSYGRDLDKPDASTGIVDVGNDKPTADEPVTIPVIPTTSRPRRPPKPSIKVRENRATIRAQVNLAMSDISPNPTSYEQALKSHHYQYWKEAMESEIEAMYRLDAWELCDLPPDRKAIGSRWVFKLKDDGRFRARLVARGFTQLEGLDYDGVYAPVMRWETLRILLAEAAAHGMHMIHGDVETAFLNSELEETIYLQQPKGHIVSGSENKVLRLKKALYGLKQSGHDWFHKLDRKIRSIPGTNFIPCKIDPYIYLDINTGVLIIIYIDDILFISKDLDIINDIYDKLSLEFKMKNLGEVETFLGLQIKRDEYGVSFNQSNKIKKLIDDFGLHDAKPAKTPLDDSVPLKHFEDGDIRADVKTYQQIIGSLQHLSTCSRPDITYAVNKLSHYALEPNSHHMNAAKHILRYLKGTVDYSIHYGAVEALHGYSDSSYATDLDDAKSFSGYGFFFHGGLIMWSATKQNNVTISSTESEYVGASNAICEAIHLRQHIAEIEHTVDRPATVIKCDNTGAITLSTADVFHRKVKHIQVRYHHIRDEIV